jgi:hypothetical protein
MTQTESPLEPVDTVHLGLCCGRYDLMREVHQYPYYPTAYPYAGTIADDSQRQPTTQIQTTSDLRRQQATSDNQSKRTPKPQVAGSIPVPPANPGFMRGEALFRTHNVSPTWLCLIELPQVSSLTH